MPEAEPSDSFELPEIVVDGEPGDEPPYHLPDARVLRKGTAAIGGDPDAERIARTLLGALSEHGVEARLVGTVSGPRVTRYELQLAPGTKVSRVSGLRDDLAYALATTEIRILAPIPGKQAVGVEVPEPLAEHRHARRPRSVDPGPGASPLSVWLGKDIAGHVVHADLDAHAAHADRRHDGLGQVGLHQRDAVLDPAARDAGRGADDPRRPQEGRAQPLRDDPAPADAGRHEHEARGRRAPEHRARDGEPLRDHGHRTGRAT